MLVLAGDSVRSFPRPVSVRTTLSRGKLRIPYKLLGTMRACALHDWLVARQLPRMADKVDIIHAWPLASLNTIKVAKRLGIPVALERCNAHTRFAYEVVQKECEHIGVRMPKGHEHAYNENILLREEEEYNLADVMLCPSEFVVKTFLDQGFSRSKLVRFFYGVDEKLFYPHQSKKNLKHGLTMIFVGVCAVRKGLHYALDAWLKSSASSNGTFLVAGEFLPEYKKKLTSMLSHPSVRVLGHRTDIPELMRKSDLFVLPSIEEGFGLACTEAMASGCVPLVSEACTDLCRHMENALVHRVGDVMALLEHINMLNSQPETLARLRDAGLGSVPSISWTEAGKSLLNAYQKVVMQRLSTVT